MKTLFLSLVLLLQVNSLFSQKLNLSGVTLNVGDHKVVTLQVNELKDGILVSRIIEINKIIEIDGTTKFKNRTKLKVKKRSNKSQRVMSIGKYELIVKTFIDGVVSVKKEIFEIK